MVVVNPEPGLLFGAANLVGTDAELAANGYRLCVLGDDLTWGNPAAIQRKVNSWLQDGAIVELQGYDNRDDMVVPVLVEGVDLDKVALGEAALMAECGRPNTLTWTPPDGVGAPTVFSVVMSSLELDTDDLRENLLERVYVLRIQAEPFARSQNMVTVTVVAPTEEQELVTVDDCSSLTGWAVSYSPPAGSPGQPGPSGPNSLGLFFDTVVGQSQNWSPGTGFAQVTLTRTGLSASIATTPYLRVQVSAESSGEATQVGLPVFTVDGVVVPVTLQEGTSYWLDTTGLGLGSTIESVAVAAKFQTTSGSTILYIQLSVSDISRSNILGSQSTNRQLARTIEVAGSARTQASLSLSDETNALGSVLIYSTKSRPGLAQPNLRQFLTSGNTETGDDTTVSGFTSDLTDMHTFDIPAASLQPGGHVLMVRMLSLFGGDYTFDWAARSRVGGVNLPDAKPQEGTIILSMGADAIVTVANRLNLPPRKLGPNGVVRIELTCFGGVMDEAWLFNVETGFLTQVDCGTGTPAAGGPSNRLWLDAPTVSSPVPALYLGTEADRSDSFHAADEAESFLVHEFAPPSMNVFTVTTGSDASTVAMSHYPRWHSHAVTP